MATPPPEPGAAAHPPRGRLAAALTALAGTPDDASDIDTLLVTIARLTADTVEPVSYASITAYRAGMPTTVAASSQIAVAVDLAQYEGNEGPCLDALSNDKLVEVADVAAVMSWPGFRDTALRLGLHASLSIPLFAARGATVAALNLYARGPEPIAALSRRVRAVFDPGSIARNGPLPTVEDGERQFLSGIAAALQIRAVIQQALGVIMGHEGVSAETAYLLLRMIAVENGATLVDTATAIIQEQVA
jgi:hypothetical protein